MQYSRVYLINGEIVKLSRRDFLKLSGVTALGTALASAGISYEELIAKAQETDQAINVVWTHNGGCGGNTIAFIDAMNPALEDVFTGVYFNGKPITLRQPSIPGLPNVNLVYHPILMPQDSMAYATMQQALNGELDPYILVVEGTLYDEFGLYSRNVYNRQTGQQVSYGQPYKTPPSSGQNYPAFWCSAGRKPDGTILTCDEFVFNLMKKAAAVVATGACATYGGIPSTTNGLGYRSPTYTMGMLDDPYRGIYGFPYYVHQVYQQDLAPNIIDADIYQVTNSPVDTSWPGPSYHWKSKGGLPIIAIAADPPAGDWIMRTLVSAVLYLIGVGPNPADDLDVFNRPKFFYGNETHQNCPRAGFFAQGIFATKFGDPQCTYSLGCKGTEANSPAPLLGWSAGVGGCTRGGVCIACTAPGFPDLYEPFFVPPNAPTIPSTTLLAAAAAAGIVVGVGTWAFSRYRRRAPQVPSPKR